MKNELIRMENIIKTFGKVKALEGITFAIRDSEILGIVGDNGAGKSTLIKILAGVMQPDSGKIYYRGELTDIKNPMDAINLGIEVIFQDSSLVQELSIARNLFLGREPVKKRLAFLKILDKAYMQRKNRELLKRVGIKKEIDSNTTIDSLSGGERQSIAIARAMFFKADLVILDEPTNNLGIEESKKVLEFIKETKAEGQSSIFITHNIHHIFQAVDRIMVMRLGKVIGNLIKEDTTVDEIEALITGEIDKKIPASL